jgi:hypothetical protein
MNDAERETGWFANSFDSQFSLLMSLSFQAQSRTLKFKKAFKFKTKLSSSKLNFQVQN